MAFPLIPLIAAGALGLGKSVLIDKPREKRQRKVAAETIRYSPWTGLSAQPIQEADPFGSTLQGAALGASLAQAYGGGQSPVSSGTLNSLSTAPMSEQVSSYQIPSWLYMGQQSPQQRRYSL